MRRVDAESARGAAAPEWLDELVLYELNPRTFTSPHGAGDGSGSGTFITLRDKLPYLRDLGINGIWMAGHSLATKHFYGIWSVYAADRPDLIDPALGTPDDLRALVDSAHRLGIRIFLDVISHGLVKTSSLVAEQPDWFRGGSWEMLDYDYDNLEFRRWWTDLWVDHVQRYDIDGYRVDVSLVDPTVWDTITHRCAALGKPIAVFPENGRYHFGQQERHGAAVDPVLDWAIAREFGHGQHTLRQLSSHDRGWEALPGNHYAARGSRAKLGYGLLLNPQIPLFFAGEEFNADPQPLPALKQGLYGTGGTGGWLYGCRLDWNQLNDPAKRSVFNDVRGYLAARRRYSHLINADIHNVEMTRVPANGASALVPFARYIPGSNAVVILGNDLPSDVEFRVQIPLDLLGFGTADRIRMVDILNNDREQLRTPQELHDYALHVGADYTPGGGVRALYLEPAEQ